MFHPLTFLECVRSVNVHVESAAAYRLPIYDNESLCHLLAYMEEVEMLSSLYKYLGDHILYSRTCHEPTHAAACSCITA